MALLPNISVRILAHAAIGDDSWYPAAMAKQKNVATKGSKSGRFVLGSDRFAKISKVEGIELTPAMKKRASDARTKGFTAEEYRQAIIRSHRKG
ncbi:hypothetical protein V1277_001919 [Bradyrhizobium sp. AZCC 1588]|uniref:hypothetical protein n=1 Tax=unclassified Bradyrhizobium TaxID=2631580 RepID=UPI002FEFB65E